MTTKTMDRFTALASLLEYPRYEFKAALKDISERLGANLLSENKNFDSFRSGVDKLTTAEMEELYTRTFDLNPVCTLEVGWQLYGDDYKRGAFMVKMRQLLRDCDIAEAAELPDHLTYMLMALDRIEMDSGKELADRFIRPALKKMMEGFKDKSNPYFFLLQFLDAELAQCTDIERKAES